MPQTTDIIDPETAATIAGLFRERVRRTPHSSAYQSYSAEKQKFETITWKEMSALAARWQAAFEREGLQPGDRVRPPKGAPRLPATVNYRNHPTKRTSRILMRKGLAVLPPTASPSALLAVLLPIWLACCAKASISYGLTARL